MSESLVAWVDEARRISVRQELERRGLWSTKMLGDSGVPCPVCGGTDRFAVNLKKNVFYCRASGRGGDALALAQYLDGSDFLTACETVSGLPRPDGRSSETPGEKAEREERQRQRREEARRALQREKDLEIDYRETERARCYRIWKQARPIFGTPAEDYLRARRLDIPDFARLRFLDAHALWSNSEMLHKGPAMIGAMVGPDGKFAGVHQTWLDPAGPKGKARIVDPATGLVVPAKKTRGSWKGATVPLVQQAAPVRCFLGEGNETVLAVWGALCAAGLALVENAEFRSACNLGNLSGKARDRVAHPTERIVRKDSKDGGARKIPGAEPVPVIEDFPMIWIADSVRELFLLGDGDSDPFATDLALRRAGARFGRAYPSLTIRLAMAAPGMDFNDMLLASRVVGACQGEGQKACEGSARAIAPANEGAATA